MSGKDINSGQAPLNGDDGGLLPDTYLHLIKRSQEPMSRSVQLPYKAYVTAFLQTDLFLVYLFFCERKALPVQ